MEGRKTTDEVGCLNTLIEIRSVTFARSSTLVSWRKVQQPTSFAQSRITFLSACSSCWSPLRNNAGCWSTTERAETAAFVARKHLHFLCQITTQVEKAEMARLKTQCWQSCSLGLWFMIQPNQILIVCSQDVRYAFSNSFLLLAP